MNVVFIGHVDAGKSTTGGQILYLTVRCSLTLSLSLYNIVTAHEAIKRPFGALVIFECPNLPSWVQKRLCNFNRATCHVRWTQTSCTA